jgi:hypothetical protein
VSLPRASDSTAVVVLSDRLREGQMRGILQHVAAAERWLAGLADTQLEDVDPTVAPVLAALGGTDALVYTPRS